MNEEKLIWGASYIDDDLVCEAIDYKPHRIRLAPWACAAAAAVVMVTAFAVFARQIGSSPVLPPDPANTGYSAGNSSDPNVANSMPGSANASTLSGNGTSNCIPDNSVPPSTGTSAATESTITTVDEPVTPGIPVGDKKAYDDVFEEFYPENQNPTAYGPPMTYEEVMNGLKPRPDYPEHDVDSYYLVEVIRALTYEEYMKMAGWSVDDGKTVYEVKLVEDLISGEKLDRTEFILLPTGRGASIQRYGDPTYAPGERLTAALTKPCEGYDFVLSTYDFALRYDLPQMSFTDDDKETMLYFRGRGLARVPIADLPFDTEEINIEAAYSTPQNPATYIQKIALDDLVEFLRTSWEEAGISSHFENNTEN